MTNPETPTVERFDLEIATTGYTSDHSMKRSDDGEWVRHADYFTLHAEKEQQRAILAELVDVYERIAANLGGPKAHSYAEAMMDVVADLRALVDPPQQKET